MSRLAFELRPKHFNVFYLVFRRHLAFAWKNKFVLLQSIAFLFVMVTVLKIAMGGAIISPAVGMGIVNILMILSLLLSSDFLLYEDFKNNYLEQFIITGVLLEVILFAKWFAHFIIFIIPFLISLPILSNMLSCSALLSIYTVTIVSLLIANTNLILIFCNSVCLGHNKSSLMALLLMPLIIPSVIFSTLGVENHSYIWLMVACFLFIFPVSMIAGSFVIKSIINQ